MTNAACCILNFLMIVFCLKDSAEMINSNNPAAPSVCPKYPFKLCKLNFRHAILQRLLIPFRRYKVAVP